MDVVEVGYEARGVQLTGVLAGPAASPGRVPGVLVGPGGLGLDDFARERAARLAEVGCVTLACDYWVRDRSGDPLQLGPRMQDPSALRDVMTAALGALVADPRVDPDRVAAIGFCFGGQAVLELARAGADLKAVVGFHPGLFTARPEDAANITGRVLVMIGTADEYWIVDDRVRFEHEMTAGDVTWQMHLYGGLGHNFTSPAQPTYDAEADRHSWATMLALLADTVDLP